MSGADAAPLTIEELTGQWKIRITLRDIDLDDAVLDVQYDEKLAKIAAANINVSPIAVVPFPARGHGFHCASALRADLSGVV